MSAIVFCRSLVSITVPPAISGWGSRVGCGCGSPLVHRLRMLLRVRCWAWTPSTAHPLVAGGTVAWVVHGSRSPGLITTFHISVKIRVHPCHPCPSVAVAFAVAVPLAISRPTAHMMWCMGSTAPDITALKSKMREAWMAGDFGVIARYAEKAEEEFVERLQLAPGTRVLDVACGTGNTAIPAARAGAQVIGVDIASNLVTQARERARQAGVTAEFREGDAEQLDFPDAAFDVVISVFGAMFAPRPERVAAELLRVCRPGGTIAMGNWTPAGFVGTMFALSAKHVPPPAGIPAPSMWGDEAVVRQRFGSGAKHITCTRTMCDFRYPFPPSDVVKLFRDYFGPTQVAFSKLDAKGQSAMASDLERLWNENNLATDGTTLIPGEYLEVRVVRA